MYNKISNLYFNWLDSLVSIGRYRKPFSYQKLLMLLHDTEFVYICDLDRLGNQFNTPIYDNNWYILGLFIDGVLYRINSCNGKDEIIKR